MFVLLLLATLVGAGLLLPGDLPGLPTRTTCLAAAVIPGLILVRVVLEMLLHRGGVIDWTQGGVVSVSDDAGRLRWPDWAIWRTRRGIVFKASRTLRLEQRWLCGLIPLGTTERSLDDFYRLKVRRDVVKVSPSIEHDPTPRIRIVRFDFSVELVERGAQGLVVLDFSESADRGTGFIGPFRNALEATLQDRPARADDDAEPAPSDFDAWRAERESDGA